MFTIARTKSINVRGAFTLVEIIVVIMIVGIASTAAFVGGGTIVNDARVSTTVRDLGHFESAITNALFDHPEAGTYTNNSLTGKIAAIVRDINDNLDDGEKIINPTTALTEEDSHGSIYINADVPDTGEYVILASEKKDPWGNPYYFIFDTSTRQVGTSQFHITVVSAGPNATAEIGGIIDEDDVFLLDEQLNGRVYTAIYNCSEIDGFDEYDNNYVSALVGFPETYDGTASLRSATGQESLPVTGGGNIIPAAGNHELSNPMLTLTRSEGTITVNSTTTVNVDRQGTGALSVMSANTSVARARIEGSIVKITGVAEGTTTITVQCAETVQYLAGVAIYTVTVKEGIIEKLTPAKPTLSPASLTLSVDGGSGNITVSHDGTGVVSAYSSPSGIVTTSVDGDTVSITPVKSGTATVTFLVAEDETYKATSAKATITILASSCTVSFSSGAGSGSMDPVIVAKGSSYLLPANGFEAPDHMQFKAWSIGGVEYAARTRYTVSEDVTAVAVWQGLKHTVTYNNGGGKGTKDSEQVAYNTVITLPASNTFVAQAHKQFLAWDVNGEEYSAGADYTITGNTTITAVWEYVKHTVSYANGGGGGTKANEVLDYNTVITLPPADTFSAPEHKQFKAWLIGSTEHAAETNYTVRGDITITAVWENAQHTVTYDNGGGTGTRASEQIEYNTSVVLPASNAFTAPANKKFKAWSINGAEYTAGESYTVTEDITVTAVWEYITYFVSYRANGGSGSKETEQIIIGTEIYLPASSLFSPPTIYQQFKAWRVGGVEYEAGTAYTVRSNISITAVWEDLTTYTVRFNSNRGSSVPSQIVIEGEQAVRPEEPTRRGYTFTGWTYGGAGQVDLPSGYTQLEYLESTGTQYINTNYVPTSNSSIEGKIAMTELTNGNVTGVSYDNNSGARQSVMQMGYSYDKLSSAFYYDALTNYTTGIRVSLDTADTEFHTYFVSANKIKIDDVEREIYNASINVNGISIYLFKTDYWGGGNARQAAGIGKQQIEWFMIYENGTVVRQYIPARRDSDSVLGMYETETGTFLTNAGTGTFVSGPDVASGELVFYDFDLPVTRNLALTANWERAESELEPLYIMKDGIIYDDFVEGWGYINYLGCGDSSLIPNSTDASGNPCVLFQTPNFQIYTKVSTNHVDWEGYTTLNIRANPYVEMPDSNRYADYGNLCVGLTTRGPGSTRGYGEGIATVVTPHKNENGVTWPIGQTFTASVDLPETNPGNLYLFIQQHRASAYIYEIWLE